VIYYHFAEAAEIWLVTLYAKGEVEDLSPEEKRRLAGLIDRQRHRRGKPTGKPERRR
jgi:hypothetical protein